MEREFYIGHIAEPFPQVYEFTLSRRAFLYILPDGRGGFCSAYREEKIKGPGQSPSSEVMALRKYLKGAILCRFHEGRGIVAFSALAARRETRETIEESGLEQEAEIPSEEGAEECAIEEYAHESRGPEREEVYCSFSRHAAPALILKDRQILGQPGAPTAQPAPEDFPEFRAGTGDDALRNYFQDCQNRVLRQIENLIKKQNTLMEQVRLDQGKYARHEDISRDGELLKSQLWLAKRGMKEVTLTDYFAQCAKQAEPAGADGEAMRIIALDPLLSPQENAAKIFARAAKYRRGLAALEKRLPEIETTLAELEETRKRVSDFSYPDFAPLQPYFLRAGSRGKKTPSQPGAPSTKGQRRSLPYRVFEKEETIIWVGKDAKANALLSLKLAAGNDLWFHAKNYPGSHVLLRRRNKKHTFTEREVYDAALLALYYSEARPCGREEVLYTEAKHIRAVPGARTGTVHAAAGRSLTVTLDEERLAEAKRPFAPPVKP
jgi:predicted ribosome quality control (RQC) complex YloA/Tae2 family protein